MINFSIIIPHKNIPELLERCLKSIPERDDIQVIAVDDVFERGAGCARNIGLQQAQGKWLIFADADDFFLPDFEKMLEKYVDSEADMICFANTSARSKTLKPLPEKFFSMTSKMREALASYPNIDIIRYNTGVVWCRFIKREMVEKNKIKFQETICRNDTLFAVKIGCAAKEILLDETEIYCYTQRHNNTANNATFEYQKVRFFVSKSVMKFLRKQKKNAQIFNDDLLFYYGIIKGNDKMLYIKEFLPVLLLTTTKKAVAKAVFKYLYMKTYNKLS
ncbi:MAG: glycosyltransferase family 2 protein [Prevotellaceae bacterium]|nr:glycosyltransferase family 2 protein [Prevotellaceae bacterium]